MLGQAVIPLILSGALAAVSGQLLPQVCGFNCVPCQEDFVEPTECRCSFMDPEGSLRTVDYTVDGFTGGFSSVLKTRPLECESPYFHQYYSYSTGPCYDERHYSQWAKKGNPGDYNDYDPIYPGRLQRKKTEQDDGSQGSLQAYSQRQPEEVSNIDYALKTQRTLDAVNKNREEPRDSQEDKEQLSQGTSQNETQESSQSQEEQEPENIQQGGSDNATEQLAIKPQSFVHRISPYRGPSAREDRPRPSGYFPPEDPSQQPGRYSEQSPTRYHHYQYGQYPPYLFYTMTSAY